MPHQGGLYQIYATVRAPHVLVEEHGDGTLRITNQGQPLGFHAITSRPMKTAEAKTVYQPRPGHAEAGSSVAPAPVARTHTLCGGGRNIKPDISTVGESGHFYLGLTILFLGQLYF